MAEGEEMRYSIYEARDEKMVSKDGNHTVRIARFLKPLAQSVNQAVKVPHVPLLCEIFSENSQKWPSDVRFRGWSMPQKQWEEWLDCLAEDHGFIWNQTGICDAIISSRYELRCNKDVIFGVLEYWCPETNTFVFPWGEATITLEDIMNLVGLPVLGEPMTKPLTGDLVKIEEEMNKHRKEIYQSKSKKASHGAWLKHFMGKNSEYEHVGFLSLWLSRFILPSLPEHTIQKHDFAIAIHLSQGTKIALAPAVVASLYKNMRLLKEQAAASLDSITVSGLLQIVQLWVFERFPLLGPQCPNPLKPGEPRAARWHKLNSKISLPLVRSALKVPDNFRWRPYADNLDNWQHSSYYHEAEQVVLDNSSSDEELQSFVSCLHASELVGLDCKESYMPHRVSMLFGIDQDLPGELYGSDFTLKNIRFFVPSRTSEAGVSLRYLNWWKECKLTRKMELEDILKQERTPKKTNSSPSIQTRSRNNGSLSFAKNLKNHRKLTRLASKRQQDFDDTKRVNSEESRASVITKPPSDVNNQRSEEDECDDMPISQVLKRHHAAVA